VSDLQPTHPNDRSEAEADHQAGPPSIWIGLVPMTLIGITALIASVRVWHWWPIN
jgi:hypothetical protein